MIEAKIKEKINEDIAACILYVAKSVSNIQGIDEIMSDNFHFYGKGSQGFDDWATDYATRYVAFSVSLEELAQEMNGYLGVSDVLELATIVKNLTAKCEDVARKSEELLTECESVVVHDFFGLKSGEPMVWN